MSSEYSVSTTATQQQRAAAVSAARDKKSSDKGEDTTVRPLSTNIITGGSDFGNKFTHVDFHPILPWMLATTKHGCKILGWNVEANKLVTTISLLEMLTFQRPHPTNTNGSWTEFYTGRFIGVSFVDEGGMLWRRHKMASVIRGNDSSPSGQEVFGVCGPEYDTWGQNASAASQTLSPQADAMASVESSSGGGKGNDVAVLVVTETVVAVVQLGTASIQHSLFSHQVNNRQFTTMTVVPMVSCTRPLCLLGCTDGCIIAWDPMAPGGRNFSVIMTPHSSRIVTIQPIYFIPSNPASILGGAGVEGSSSFMGGRLAIVIATEGGSVTKIRFRNRDEIEVEFQCKKVHDSVLSMCTAPANEVERRITHDGLAPDAKDSQIREMLESLSKAAPVYSLGPSYIVVQDGQTGVEIRKVKIKGLGFARMVPTPQHLLLGTGESKQYRVDWDLNFDTHLQCSFDLQRYLQQSKESTKFTRFVPQDSADNVALSPPGPLQIKEEEKDLHTYCLVQHVARENIVLAACTNKGIFVMDGMNAGQQVLFNFPSTTPDEFGGTEGGVVSRFLHLDKAEGKLSSFKCNASPDELLHMRLSRQLMSLSMEMKPPKNIFPTSGAATRETIYERNIVFEPSGGIRVASIWPSPCNELVAIITNTREIQLYETRRNFASMTVPTMNRADSIAWASNSIAFASLAADTRRISVAQVNRIAHPASAEASGFQISPSTHDVMGSNVPIGISGGRWLCIHYEASFSGLSSQFFRWEPGSVGGGAIGNFIPQPRLLQWDSTATLCALAYEGTISFMSVRRKLFSQLSAVDVASPPTDIMFHNRCLFVIFQREIMLLLPTPMLVQKVLIASLNPAVAAGGSSLNSGLAAMYSYRVALRPLGRLRLQSVWEGSAPSTGDESICKGNSVTLCVSDQHDQVFTIPLSQSVAQLLLYVHQYNFQGSTEAQRAVVDACLQGTSDAKGVGNTMFADAVRHFVVDCGFDGGEKSGSAAATIHYDLIADDVERLMKIEELQQGEKANDALFDPNVTRLKIVDNICSALSKRFVGSWISKDDVLAEGINIVGQFSRAAEKKKERSEKDRLRYTVLNDVLFEMFIKQSN